MTSSPSDKQTAPITNDIRTRHWLANLGLVLGPVLAVSFFFALRANEVAIEAATAASIVVFMAVWWMTEAVPLAVTALTPLVLFPLLPVYPTEPRAGELVRYEIEAIDSAEPQRIVGTFKEEQGDVAVIETRKANGESELVNVPIRNVSKVDTKGAFEKAAEPFANKFIFLFLGGFLIALSIERWNLHRRLALLTLSVFGTGPRMIVAGFMCATAGLSMWISNTATTVMMLPIALSVVTLIQGKYSENEKKDSSQQENHFESNAKTHASSEQVQRFATCLMLAIAYAASLGGVATLVGTPPNALLASFLDSKDLSINFASWMLFALPISLVFLVIVWAILTYLVFPFRLPELTEGRKLIHTELKRMGRMSPGERITLVVFVSVAVLWIGRVPLSNWEPFIQIAPWFKNLSDPAIAMMGGLSLFAIPVRLRPLQMAMNWETAKRLPWGVLLLFGGGLTLANAVQESGLGEVIGNAVASNTGMSILGLVILTTVVVVFLTEFTSNMATASLFLPILFQVAIQIQEQTGADFPPEYLLVPATLAASFAFMLPVATPPNAIVFGSEQVTIGQMVKAGFTLNLIACVLLPILVVLLAPTLLGF